MVTSQKEEEEEGAEDGYLHLQSPPVTVGPSLTPADPNLQVPGDAARPALDRGRGQKSRDPERRPVSDGGRRPALALQ